MSDPYSNEYQQKVVEKLHEKEKAIAVEAATNSEIHVYMRNGSLLAAEVRPYEIAHVLPLNEEAYWTVHIVLRANWSEVDQEVAVEEMTTEPEGSDYEKDATDVR